MEAQNDNNSGAPLKFGPLMKLYIRVCGVVEEILQQCPKKDHDNIRALGRLLLGAFLWQSIVLCLVSRKLFAAPGEIRPDLVLGAFALAAQVMMIDSYVFFCSGFEIAGIAGLLRGGLDVGGGPGRGARFGFLLVRLLLSLGMAQLLALFVALIIFSSDIHDRVLAVYEKTNAHLIADTTAIVDADIQRVTDAVKSETARVDGLSGQIAVLRGHDIDPTSNDPRTQQAQKEVNQLMEEEAEASKAVVSRQDFAVMEAGGVKAAPSNSGIVGNGPRYRAAMEAVENAKRHQQEVNAALQAARARLDGLRKELSSSSEAEKQRSHGELPGYKATLATEEAKLSNLKDQLDGLTNGRPDAIRKAVERAPDYVPLNDGFLAQLRAIEQISSEDRMIGTVIFLIDLASMALELAGVIAKVTSYVPMKYCDRLARDAYATDVRMVDELMAELNKAPGNDNQPPPELEAAPANDNKPNGNGSAGAEDPFADLDSPPPEPPKRGRGRPRKNANGGLIKSAKRKAG